MVKHSIVINKLGVLILLYAVQFKYLLVAQEVTI